LASGLRHLEQVGQGGGTSRRFRMFGRIQKLYGRLNTAIRVLPISTQS
jgi:hypothetical protein